MNTSQFFAAAVALASTVSAASFSTNFDSQPAGSLASLFATANVAFHNGVRDTVLDSEGAEIAGSEQWQIDTASNATSPLTVSNPSTQDYGAAPSGTNALNGLDQAILLVFTQAMDITGFSVTLDNSTFGNLFATNIEFVNGATVLATLPTEQFTAGFMVTGGSAMGVTAIVLPAGAYYDDLAFNYEVSAIPEPSSFAALAGLAGLALAASRRRRA